MGTNIKVLLLCFCIQGDPMPQSVRLFLLMFKIYKKKQLEQDSIKTVGFYFGWLQNVILQLEQDENGAQ